MKKILVSLIGIFGFASVAFALPYAQQTQGLFPGQTDVYYIGTTTPSTLQYLGIFTKDLTISNLGGSGTRCVQVDTNGLLAKASAACGSGSGGGGTSGTWATTTSTHAGRLINYPLNSTDIVVIGDSATTTAPWFYDPNTFKQYIKGTLTLNGGFIANASSTISNLGSGGVATQNGLLYSFSTSTLSIGGNAATATALANARTISISGDLTYTSPAFDGSANVTAAGTLATVNSNVGSFTNASITVNGKGLVTAASSGTAPVTSVSGSGVITSTGGFTPTIAYTGLATSSALTGGRLLYSDGKSSVTDVATTSVTCSGSVSCATFNVLGSSPVTITGSGSGGTGLSTTSPVSAGNLLVYSATGAGSAFGVATTSVTCTGNVTCPTFNVLGSSPITINIPFEFTPSSYNGVNNNATTTGIMALPTSGYGLIASSTFTTFASTTNLSSSGDTWLATNGTTKVGIGTTSPSALLSIDGGTGPNNARVCQGAGNACVQFGFTASGNQAATIGTLSNAGMFFMTNGATRMNITNTGLIGIATTTSQWPLEILSATKPQLDLYDNSFVEGNHWTLRSIAGSLFFASSTYSATSTVSAFSIDPNGYLYNPTIKAASGTNCLQVSTTGQITNTGSACGGGSGTVTQVNSTYPITGGGFTTSGTLALAFGTTTSNTWAGIQTFAGLTAVNATSTGTQAIPVSASASTPVAGTIAIDSTTGQLRFSDVTGTTRVITERRDLGFAYATTTWGTTATTTLLIGPSPGNITVTAAFCETDTGTLGVSLTDATPNRADYIRTASSTINKNFYTTNNNSFTEGESIRASIGTPASSPTKVSCRFIYSYDAD